MNRLDALLYIAAADAGGRLDLRLATYIAAMKQMQVGYKDVDFSSWWSARCQIGMLAGDMDDRAAFAAQVPCGKSGKVKVADADEFADPAYKPTFEDVEKALRNLHLLKIGARDPPDPQETLDLAK